MKGIELAREFYKAEGEPMLRRDFPELLPLLAVGLIGSGSECFGFDDEISKDHDFEPAFCIFIPESIDEKTAFALSRAYQKLPSEFKGFKRSAVNPVGGSRHGVIRTGEFFAAKCGRSDGVLSYEEWLTVPEFSLFEAVNGELFADNLGEVTAIRERLSYFPEDIRLKRLAGNLLLASQAGQYNYSRCLSRDELGAAQLAVIEFVKAAMQAVFLINKKYMPYYKWSFRAMRELLVLGDLAGSFEYLISSKNDKEEAAKKRELIEQICEKISAALSAKGSYLEPLAYEINGKISDNNLRNMHILSGV